jgi:hypothetical protein
MWTQRHKAQKKTCEHSGTKHKAKHVDITAQSTKQNIWTRRHKAQSETCEQNGTKRKAKICVHNGTKHKAKRVK